MLINQVSDLGVKNQIISITLSDCIAYEIYFFGILK